MNGTPPKIVLPTNVKLIFFRLFIALCVGAVVTALSLYVAWRNVRGMGYYFEGEQSLTIYQLGECNAAITNYENAHHAPPRSLNDLQSIDNRMSTNEQGQVLDGWRRPFIFSSDGTNLLVTSYGRDGKPGGVGLDADLSNRDLRPESAKLTFGQFFHEEPLNRMITTCYVCGILAALISVFTVKLPERADRSQMLQTLFVLAATVVGALIFASVISALHIPSGH